jgi:hypothetical protein
MERLPNSKTHFHILWIDHHRLDWECFLTRNEAEARALELAQPGEVFQIEELARECPLLGKDTDLANESTTN